MTCESWRSKLGPYVDSELPEGELADMEAHLRACPECAADALGRVQLKRLTQSVGTRYSPTPQFHLRIEQKIRSKRKPVWHIWRAGWVVPKLAAAAVVLAFVIGIAALWLKPAQREQALTELTDMHVTTLASANPVDVISTDRHTVKPWFAGRLPFTFNIPDLQGSPYKLVGGRVVYVQHSPGAQLLWDVGNHRLSVFIFQDRPGLVRSSKTSLTSHELAFNVETWAESGLRYVVISDADSATVHGVSELLRRAGHP